MTQPTESLNDAMGMVSIHGRAVLVAMINSQTEELQMLNVTTPQASLKITEASADGLTMGEFFDHLAAEPIAEFRVKFWKHSAVAHRIPTCPGMQSQSNAATRYPVPTRHASMPTRVAASS